MERTSRPSRRPDSAVRTAPTGREVLVSTAIFSAVTAVVFIFDALEFSDANLIMVFIFGVVLVSVRTGRLLGVLASVSSVTLFNFFFTEPRFTFAVNDTQYLFTFAVMLAVALITSALTVREQLQAKRALERERRANVLLRMSRALLTVSGSEAICTTSISQIGDAVAGTPFIYLIRNRDRSEHVHRLYRYDRDEPEPDGAELRAMIESIGRETVSGIGTGLVPEAYGLYLPLTGSEGRHGVLCLVPGPDREPPTAEERSLLETFAALISLALDRERILSRHEEAKVRAENDKLRVTILRSISHDFRTPLAGITGASSTLLAASGELSDTTNRDLLESIFDEATWLSELVDNILSLTRVQSSGGVIRKVPEVLDDVVLSAVQRVRKRLRDHELTVRQPDELMLVSMDGMLIEQVLINLLENAVHHTPSGTKITLSTRSLVCDGVRFIEFRVEDTGPGIPETLFPTLFDLFKPNAETRRGRRRGAGLGLGICRTIVEAHGGTISAGNRPEGGAWFGFTLPVDRDPVVSVEREDET